MIDLLPWLAALLRVSDNVSNSPIGSVPNEKPDIFGL